jgi:acetyltransferase-like isoleucine patch superfamily enzyme
MVKAFLKYLKNKWVQWKIELKIHVVYTSRYPDCRIESILSNHLEKLVLPGVWIGKNTNIESCLQYLGKHVYIGWDTAITQTKSIGNFSCISNGVKIGLTNHALDHLGTHPLFYRKRRGWVDTDTYDEGGNNFTEIGPDVLISANVIVLKGVKIGAGAVVAAGAVVTANIPPYAIVAGVPAKIIRYRFNDETIQALLKSEWWNLSDKDLLKHKSYFNNPGQILKNLS